MHGRFCCSISRKFLLVILYILTCFAFTPKPFPYEGRRFFEIRHRLAFLMGVKELVEKHGCVLASNGFEKKVERGVIDGELIDPFGNPITLETTGSDWIKLQKIIQACLYRAGKPGGVWVSSINERIECPPSLIRTINDKVHELVEFRNQYPEIASKLYMPNRDICPLCDNTDCPIGKPTGVRIITYEKRYKRIKQYFPTLELYKVKHLERAFMWPMRCVGPPSHDIYSGPYLQAWFREPATRWRNRLVVCICPIHAHREVKAILPMHPPSIPERSTSTAP